MVEHVFQFANNSPKTYFIQISSWAGCICQDMSHLHARANISCAQFHSLQHHRETEVPALSSVLSFLTAPSTWTFGDVTPRGCRSPITTINDSQQRHPGAPGSAVKRCDCQDAQLLTIEMLHSKATLHPLMCRILNMSVPARQVMVISLNNLYSNHL